MDASLRDRFRRALRMAAVEGFLSGLTAREAQALLRTRLPATSAADGDPRGEIGVLGDVVDVFPWFVGLMEAAEPLGAVPFAFAEATAAPVATPADWPDREGAAVTAGPWRLILVRAPGGIWRVAGVEGPEVPPLWRPPPPQGFHHDPG